MRWGIGPNFPSFFPCQSTPRSLQPGPEETCPRNAPGMRSPREGTVPIPLPGQALDGAPGPQLPPAVGKCKAGASWGVQGAGWCLAESQPRCLEQSYGRYRGAGLGMMVPHKGNSQPKTLSTDNGWPNYQCEPAKSPPSVCLPNICAHVSQAADIKKQETFLFKRNWRCFSSMSRIWDTWNGPSEVFLGEAGANNVEPEKESRNDSYAG